LKERFYADIESRRVRSLASSDLICVWQAPGETTLMIQVFWGFVWCFNTATTSLLKIRICEQETPRPRLKDMIKDNSVSCSLSQSHDLSTRIHAKVVRQVNKASDFETATQRRQKSYRERLFEK
jgi:hypothetical protein